MSRMVVGFIIYFILRNPPGDWNLQAVPPFALITWTKDENQEEARIYIFSYSQPISQPLGKDLLCFSFSVTYLPKAWLSFKGRDNRLFNFWLDYIPEPHKLPAQTIPGMCREAPSLSLLVSTSPFWQTEEFRQSCLGSLDASSPSTSTLSQESLPEIRQCLNEVAWIRILVRLLCQIHCFDLKTAPVQFD